MDAQEHEVEAWLGGQWDETATAELVARIRDSRSDDEADWIAICQQHDDTLDLGEAGETDRASRAALRSAVRASVWAGMSESEAARRSGVTRMTVRAWLGK